MQNNHTVTVINYAQVQFERTFEACVDDRFQLITMPMSWKDSFGTFGQAVEQSWLKDFRVIRAGPVKFQIGECHSHFSEVDFVQGLNHAFIGTVAENLAFTNQVRI